MRGLHEIAATFPSSLKEALKLQADEKTRGLPLAGGTDLVVQWEAGALDPPERVLSVANISELKGISDTGDEVLIGGAVTHFEIRNNAIVQTHAPGLAAAASTVGGPQMQNQGTIAGSIANASPAGDIAPSLLAAEATVVVASVSGEREIPMLDFLVGYKQIDLKPEELIVKFKVPKLSAGHKEGFRKLGPRQAQAISKVMGAYRGAVKDDVIQEIRLAFGSVAATTIRLTETERLIAGKPFNEETLNAAEASASNEVSPIDDIRSTAAYRKWVVGRIVRGMLEELV